MRKLTNFDPQYITDTFFYGIQPDHINSGRCFQWAYIAYHMFEGVELYGLPTHAFVKYDGKYYDSECPDGEEDWKDLPACWGCTITPAFHTPESFRREWISQTRRFHTTWSKLEAMVEEAIEQRYQ